MSQDSPATASGGVGHLSKKRKGGRPESSAWDSFEKITLPEDKQRSTKRNYDGKCLACGEIVKGQPSNLLQHLANCDHVDTSRRWQGLPCQHSTFLCAEGYPRIPGVACTVGGACSHALSTNPLCYHLSTSALYHGQGRLSSVSAIIGGYVRFHARLYHGYREAQRNHGGL